MTETAEGPPAQTAQQAEEALREMFAILAMAMPRADISAEQMGRWATAFATALEEKDEQIARLQWDISWHCQRWETLQRQQRLMRNPERKIVCDILANGKTYEQPAIEVLMGNPEHEVPPLWVSAGIAFAAVVVILISVIAIALRHAG
jgi:hypothetical protein